MPRPKTLLNSWDRKVYSQGDCWMLAYEIHRVRPDLMITASCCFDCWDHVAVTDGKFVLDIFGWLPLADWLRKWGGDPEMDICTGAARSTESLMELLCMPEEWGYESCFMQTEQRRQVIRDLVLALPHPEVSEQLTG